jgi:hypothetical protein
MINAEPDILKELFDAKAAEEEDERAAAFDAKAAEEEDKRAATRNELSRHILMARIERLKELRIRHENYSNGSGGSLHL